MSSVRRGRRRDTVFADMVSLLLRAMQDIVHKNVQQVKGWRIGVGEKSWSGSGRGELELERAGKVLTLLFARVNKTHRPLIVTRKGRADAVLVGAADFDPLMDVFLLVDTVRKSRKEISDGLGIDHETAMRQFRERRGI